MNTLVIDRLEGDTAVCEENGSIRSIPRAELPQGAKEGDWLVFKDGRWCADKERTEDARKKNAALFASLQKKGEKP